MAIMVAGGLTFAMPGVQPAQADMMSSNPHLFVSAEGQDPDNMFAEGNIIEVVIVDPQISDTDEGKGEPDVTVNGADLRMLQGTDGSWYAYFAEVDALATIEANTGEFHGYGIDYGTFCTADQADAVTGGNVELTDTNGVYFPYNTVNADCTSHTDAAEGHGLIREAKDLNNSSPNGLGQLDLVSENLWPFIQTFDFTSLGPVEVVYHRSGGSESVDLIFDDPAEDHSLDRDKYPQGADVHVAITDYALNIDPTDEDTWSFNTVADNTAAYYNLFDEDGTPLEINNVHGETNYYDMDVGLDEVLLITRNAQNPASPLINCQVTSDYGIIEESDPTMDKLAQNDNGVCIEGPSDSMHAGALFTADSFVISFVEDGPNNDSFINWAEDKRSNLVVSDDALRGNTFEIEYSSPGFKSGIVGHFFGAFTFDVPDATWNSGERVGITLTDGDANTNPLDEDDLLVSDYDSLLIPSIRIGNPATLGDGSGSDNSNLDATWSLLDPVVIAPAEITINAIGEVRTFDDTIDVEFSGTTNGQQVQLSIAGGDGTTDDLNAVIVGTQWTASRTFDVRDVTVGYNVTVTATGQGDSNTDSTQITFTITKGLLSIADVPDATIFTDVYMLNLQGTARPGSNAFLSVPEADIQSPIFVTANGTWSATPTISVELREGDAITYDIIVSADGETATDSFTLTKRTITIAPIDDYATFDSMTQAITFTGIAPVGENVTLAIDNGNNNYRPAVMRDGVTWSAEQAVATPADFGDTMNYTATVTSGSHVDTASFSVMRKMLTINPIPSSVETYGQTHTVVLSGIANPNPDLVIAITGDQAEALTPQHVGENWTVTHDVDVPSTPGETATYLVNVYSGTESDDVTFSVTKKQISINPIASLDTFEDHITMTFNGTANPTASLQLNITGGLRDFTPSVSQVGENWTANSIVLVPAMGTTTYNATIMSADGESASTTFDVTRETLVINPISNVTTFTNTATIDITGIIDEDASVSIEITDGMNNYTQNVNSVAGMWSASQIVAAPGVGDSITYTVTAVVDFTLVSTTFTVTSATLTINAVEDITTFEEVYPVMFSGIADPNVPVTVTVDGYPPATALRNGQAWDATIPVNVPANVGTSEDFTVSVNSGGVTESTTFTVTKGALTINSVDSHTTYQDDLRITFTGTANPEDTVTLTIVSELDEKEDVTTVTSNSNGLWAITYPISIPDYDGPIAYTASVYTTDESDNAMFTITKPRQITIDPVDPVSTFSNQHDAVFSGTVAPGLDVTLTIQSGDDSPITPVVSVQNGTWTASANLQVPSSINYTVTATAGGVSTSADLVIVRSVLTMNEVDDIATFESNSTVNFSGIADPNDTVTLEVRDSTTGSTVFMPQVSRTNEGWSASIVVQVPDMDVDTYTAVASTTDGQSVERTFTVKRETLTIDPIADIVTFYDSFSVTASGTIQVQQTMNFVIEGTNINQTVVPSADGTWSTSATVLLDESVSTNDPVDYTITVSVDDASVIGMFAVTKKDLTINDVESLTTFNEIASIPLSGIADPNISVLVSVVNTATQQPVSSPAVADRIGEGWSTTVTVPVPEATGTTQSYTATASSAGVSVSITFEVTKGQLTIAPIANQTLFTDVHIVNFNGTARPDSTLSVNIDNGVRETLTARSNAMGQWDIPYRMDSPAVGDSTTYTITVTTSEETKSETFTVTRESLRIAVSESNVTTFADTYQITFSGAAEPDDNLYVNVTGDNYSPSFSPMISVEDPTWSHTIDMPVPTMPGSSVTYTVTATTDSGMASTSFTLTKGQLMLNPIESVTSYENNVTVNISGVAHPDDMVELSITSSDNKTTYSPNVTRDGGIMWNTTQVVEVRAGTVTHTVTATIGETAVVESFDITRGELTISEVADRVHFEDAYTFMVNGTADPTANLTLTSQVGKGDALGHNVTRNGMYWQSGNITIDTSASSGTITTTVIIDNGTSTESTVFTITKQLTNITTAKPKIETHEKTEEVMFTGFADAASSPAVVITMKNGTEVDAQTTTKTDNSYTAIANLPVPNVPGSVDYTARITLDNDSTQGPTTTVVVERQKPTVAAFDDVTSFADKHTVTVMGQAHPDTEVFFYVDTDTDGTTKYPTQRLPGNETWWTADRIVDVPSTAADPSTPKSITYTFRANATHPDDPNPRISEEEITVTRGTLVIDTPVNIKTLAASHQVTISGTASDDTNDVQVSIKGGDLSYDAAGTFSDADNATKWSAMSTIDTTSSVNFTVSATILDTNATSQWLNITRGANLTITNINNTSVVDADYVLVFNTPGTKTPIPVEGIAGTDSGVRVLLDGEAVTAARIHKPSDADADKWLATGSNMNPTTVDNLKPILNVTSPKSGEAVTYPLIATVDGHVVQKYIILIGDHLSINEIPNRTTSDATFMQTIGGYHHDMTEDVTVLFTSNGDGTSASPVFVNDTWSATATLDAPSTVGDTIEYTVNIIGQYGVTYTETFTVTRSAPAASAQSALMMPTPASSAESGFPSITKAVLNSISADPAIHNTLHEFGDTLFSAEPADWDTPYTRQQLGVWSSEVQKFSDRMLIGSGNQTVTLGDYAMVAINLNSMISDNIRNIAESSSDDCSDGFCGTVMFNYDVSSLSNEGFVVESIQLTDGENAMQIAADDAGLVMIDADKIAQIDSLQGDLSYRIILDTSEMSGQDFEFCHDMPVVIDFFSFGLVDLGVDPGDRVNNAIYRIQVEEASSNSDNFEGTVEYTMLNQLNTLEPSTYSNLRTIDDEILMIIHEDFTDEDSVRVNYLDLGADGVSTQIAIQQAAPTHSGIVTFDMESYKIADTVTVTLEDADLNVNNDVVDVYTIVDPASGLATSSTVGSSDPMIGSYTYDDGTAFGRLLDITFDDELWTSADANECTDASSFNDGFYSTGFTLIETSSNSGIFTGDFQVPDQYCQDGSGELRSVTGTDIEVNYLDFRDASGEVIERGDSAAIRANTGTVSLDRTVYPVPFGPDRFTTFGNDGKDSLPEGVLSTHIRVNDPDFDISAAGEDTMPSQYLTVNVIRGSANQTIAIDDLTVKEIAPDAGIFELDLPIAYDAGPSQACPPEFSDGCILQGDIIQVEYTDPTDASGEPNTVTDSATFDLRNGVLQADKSVYLIGSDMILTLIEPDFDLDNDAAETYDLNLIEWDSDAATAAMGENLAFDPEPSDLRETGDSTGIFQIIIEIPAVLDGDRLERGEEIELEYVDWGPSGADFVGEESEDINLTIYTSNFGATIELDQKVYSWTDKVYITIVAPDHNFDSALVDEIGESDFDPIEVSTRSDDLDNYKLVETGPDTGIFTGEVILIGFEHDADGDATTGNTLGYDNPQRETGGSGPTDGYLRTDDDDGITVSFEFSEDETVVGSALIRWNIGEVQWLESSYPATGSGVVRVIDPDMNWNPEAVDNFQVDVWSDSDAGGIDLTVTETNEATGIFEGTVVFTTTEESSGHRLRVAEANTVTAEYEDNTLPDPYTTADEFDVTATTLIGTSVPPLERVPASNLRVVDTFGNSLDSVMVGQQVQIVADLVNGQDRTQAFAYLVQVQDENGVTVSLAWITGTLEATQSLSPSSSWIPDDAGTYSATAFVWESVDNPTALSPPVTTTITVS